MDNKFNLINNNDNRNKNTKRYSWNLPKQKGEEIIMEIPVLKRLQRAPLINKPGIAGTPIGAKKEIKYTQMYSLANAPTPNMAGTFHEKERDLVKTILKAKQRIEDIQTIKEFRDKYTDCSWFEQEGYLWK